MVPPTAPTGQSVLTPGTMESQPIPMTANQNMINQLGTSPHYRELWTGPLIVLNVVNLILCLGSLTMIILGSSKYLFQ